MNYDFIIIGGGIIGISTAWQLQQRHPNKRILLLEKEDRFAAHQTGRNSGVIHAGVYYEPGSLKAAFCKQGLEATIAFCREHNIPYQQCGKLLVATSDIELQGMQALFERCQQNGIDVEMLDQAALRQREQNVSGLAAIYVKATGIVDFKEISRVMAEAFRALGGVCELQTPVVNLQETADGVTVTTKSLTYHCKYLIACAGLMADRLTRLQGLETKFRILPFRGEYYQLSAAQNTIVNHLIYPIPNPDYPFLGVHLTRMIDGSVTVGPNAVLGWKREGYGKINFSPGDTLDMLAFAGFWQVMFKHMRFGLHEMKNSLCKSAYLQQVQKYCPQISFADLLPYPTGIRAQAVLADGTLVHDFLFTESPRSLHVCNAPSPAATSAIPIGAYVCDRMENKLV
jgi:(S)-2-hydroxyglutarate dehydrogenase